MKSLLLLVLSASITLTGATYYQAAANQAASNYAGPGAGMATWTGRIGKNDTLTINGGKPSTGVLDGAGFPGVPIRLVIDQTNLAITEMPKASNDYRRLVLKSHSRHDKIVIHWTVIR